MATKTIRPSVLLVKDGKMLVLKSKYSSGEFYLLPGGGIEGFESLEQTAVREVKEETNYNIKIIKLLYLQEWINAERQKNVLETVFLGEITGGKETHLNDPTLNKGHITAIEWKTIDELKKEVFHPRDILPLIQKGIKNGFSEGGIYLGSRIE